ncbi:MAG: hypothetical protein WCF24_05190 [Acidimicrobiales bacterium]
MIARAAPIPIGTAVVAIGLIAAACGGGSGPGVASIGGSTTTTIPATSETASPTDYAKDVAYAQCMRTHGVPSFPDPNVQGDFLIHGGFSRPQLQKANAVCQHLEPNGGKQTAAQNAEALKLGLEASACMRSHGVPDFPDPQSGPNGGVLLRVGGRGANPNSAAFRDAMRACQSVFDAFGAVP